MTPDAAARAALPVEVQLRGAAWQPLRAPDAQATVGAQVGEAIADLGGSLGLSVAPDVQVRTLDAGRPDGLALQLRVASRPVRYSAVLQREVERAVDAAGDRPDVERLTTVAALLCRHACALHAGVLLGPAQVADYGGRLQQHGVSLPSDGAEAWLRELICGVLDLGISVRDVSAVAPLLAERESDHLPAVREELITRLAAARIEVLLPEQAAARVAAFDAGLGSDLLTALTGWISKETGIALPPLQASPPAGLPPGTFAVRVNDVTTAPLPLPATDSLLVNAPPESVLRVCPGAAPRPATFPGTERAASLVTGEHRGVLDEAGFTTWDREQQLALGVSSRIRERLGWCVHQDRLQAQLDALQERTPHTVLAARTACPPWQLAVLARGLAADRIPLTDVPRLLERLVEVTYLDAPQARLSLLGDPVTAVGAFPESADADRRLEAFVRTGMCHTIGHARSGSEGFLQVALLDPALEARLREDTSADESTDEALLASVTAWLATSPPAPEVPGLLVGDDVRARVAGTLAPVHPSIRVTGYGDLPAELLVLPVARVSDVDTHQGEHP